MSVSCECCVLSGRGLCVGLITRPEESYRVCVCMCVIECHQVQQQPSTPTMSRYKCSEKEIKIVLLLRTCQLYSNTPPCDPGLTPSLQDPATGHCPTSDEIIHQSLPLLRTNLIPSPGLCLGPSSDLISWGFSDQDVASLTSPMHLTCSVSVVTLNWIFLSSYMQVTTYSSDSVHQSSISWQQFPYVSKVNLKSASFESPCNTRYHDWDVSWFSWSPPSGKFRVVPPIRTRRFLSKSFPNYHHQTLYHARYAVLYIDGVTK